MLEEAWGYNVDGQLGNKSRTDSNMPVEVSSLTGVVAIAGGLDFSLALKSDGTVWAWGDDGNGELGSGSFADSTMPAQVNGLSGAVAIAVGQQFSLALRSDGTVWAWGLNDYGQFGNGTNGNNSTAPIQVSRLTSVVAIAGGFAHSLAVKSDGTAWAWGYNADGELGNGSTADSAVPVEVRGLTGVVAIAGVGRQSIALKSDGTVWTWGYNGDGELGNGSNISSTVPVPVSGLTGAVAVAAGGFHSMALVNGGTVWAWGGNPYGQLGNGSTSNSNVAVEVSVLTGAAAIGGGGAHSLSALAGSIPAVTLNPANLSFATRGPQTIAVTNSGSAPLAIGNIVLTGINPGDFSVSGTCAGTSLSPAQSCALTVTFAPAAQGNRSAAILIVANVPGSPVFIPLTGNASVTVPSLNAGGVVSTASYTAPVAPGSIASAFGSFLLTSTAASTALPAPTNLLGLSLQLGSTPPAPLFFASMGQVNLQIPWELTGQSQTTVVAALNGQASAAQTVNLAPYAPGIFATSGEGTGQGAIVDAGYRLVDSTNPATAGSSVVQIYCTGLGPVSNQLATGAPSPSISFAETTATPTVMIGGAPATVMFSGLAPGFVGEYQVNAEVPVASAKGSAVPVMISIGGVASNTVTKAVQ